MLGPRGPQGEWGPGYLSPQARRPSVMGPQPLSQACRKMPLSAPCGAHTPSPAATRTEHLAARGRVPWAAPQPELLAIPPVPAFADSRHLHVGTWTLQGWWLPFPTVLPCCRQCQAALSSSRLRRHGAGQAFPPATGAQNCLPAFLSFFMPPSDVLTLSWDPGEGSWPPSPWPTLTCAGDSRPAFGSKLCLLVISVSAKGQGSLKGKITFWEPLPQRCGSPKEGQGTCGLGLGAGGMNKAQVTPGNSWWGGAIPKARGLDPDGGTLPLPLPPPLWGLTQVCGPPPTWALGTCLPRGEGSHRGLHRPWKWAPSHQAGIWVPAV